MENISLRNYAHLGDAVWELFVREYTIHKAKNTQLLHKITTERVNSAYQSEMLNYITQFLTESELDLTRRARNCSIPVARRNNQSEYRQSTAFEAIIGYWYINDKDRLSEIIENIKSEFFS